jgi:eukaryotic-like serine/threonine-protein kinase
LIIRNLCDCLEQNKQFDRANVWRQKLLAALKKRDGPDSVAYAEELAEQGENMLQSKRYSEAEPILRDCVGILQKKRPGEWETFRAQSLLGVNLLEMQRYAEAEPLLIHGYEGLKARERQIPPLFARHRVSEAGQRIIRLYEVWGKAETAAEWRTKLFSPNDAN